MQILPPEVLSPYIKHYLFLESVGDPHKTLRLFSDGNTGIVFLLEQVHLTTNDGQHLPSSFLYGQFSNFQDLVLTEQTPFIIVVFQPDGLYKLLGISARELKEQIVATQDVFGQPAKKLYDSLRHLKQPTEKVNALNSFFYELTIQRKSLNPTLLSTILQHITYHKGLVTVEQLVHYSGYTERHVERIFAEQVGMSPKKFGSIVKLHSFLKLLRHKTAETNLTTICYQSGYFDQSHLIRAFKKYTGITPTEYLNSTNKLAVNFMEFKDGPNQMSGLYNFS
ncbi:helix-turn-helix transcriptional regulator [Flavobacterium microcysteis]|uniref:Helix-turn-helix transcriptional regulator n=1 Tax=Flavobacterium microcysteis TaxID=2596891 RepID=A0A501QFL5_9FLAO|nr:helix-turn-helix transcriptional regulator [Flavobacterium microcysteis]TPD71268.1 helix-turn-helix transcriptional regulator [Flavobacterium microcysteis]